MKNSVLMKYSEPTDKELVFLMHEVAKDAKEKALEAKLQLAQKIKSLIQKAKEKSE
jgi:hypothetical protein